MAAIILGGGAMIFRYLHRPVSPTRVMQVTTPVPGGPRAVGGPVQGSNAAKFNVVQAAAEAELPDGVHRGPEGDILFKAGDTYFRVVPQAEGEPRYTFGFFTFKDVEWEHGYLTQGIRRILAQDDFAKEIGVSEEQKKKLEDLPPAPASKWPAAERERFVSQYQGWLGAKDDDKKKAGEELLKLLRGYGDIRRAADQQTMIDRVTKIKAILNEKQIAKINPIPKWEVKPGTQPAGK